MLNLSLKEYSRIRKTIAKRIKMKVEGYLQEKKEELEKSEKTFLYEQDKYKQAEFAVQLDKENNVNRENEFLNGLRREAENYVFWHRNDEKSHSANIKSIERQIRRFESALENWRENYQAEYDYLVLLPVNVELIVKPVNGRSTGLYIVIESSYSSMFEFTRTFIGMDMDEEFFFANDLLNFLKTQEVQNKIKLYVDNKV